MPRYAQVQKFTQYKKNINDPPPPSKPPFSGGRGRTVHKMNLKIVKNPIYKDFAVKSLYIGFFTILRFILEPLFLRIGNFLSNWMPGMLLVGKYNIYVNFTKIKIF